MKLHTNLIFSGALLLPCYAFAQQPTTPPATDLERKAQDVQTPMYVTVEDIEGATLRLVRSADEGDAPEAEVTDVLLSASSGDIFYAVVEDGDKKTLVPFSSLRWNSADDCFESSYTEAQLEASPDFDADEARREDLDAYVKRVRKGLGDAYVEKDADLPATGGNKPASGDKPVRDEDSVGVQEASTERTLFPGTKYVMRNRGLVFASDLDELELYTHSEEEFGGVNRSIVDVSSGRVEFFVVSKGGVLGVGADEYLIPFTAPTMCASSTDADAEPMLCVAKSTAELEAAPKYEEPENGVLDAALAKRAKDSFKMKKD